MTKLKFFAGIALATVLAASISARTQLGDSKTELMISEEPTKDPAYLTPIPDEMPDAAVHLPDDLEFKLPYEGTHEIATGYGYEADSWTHETIGNTMSANDFYALDIDMPEGTPVLAPAPGRILVAQDRSMRDSYGNYVVIDHGQGIRTIYAHLSELAVAVQHGDPEVYVEQGTVIGKSGSKGTSWPHLHFAVHKGAFLAESGASISGQAVVPEPLDGYYGIREGHQLTSSNVAKPAPDVKGEEDPARKAKELAAKEKAQAEAEKAKAEKAAKEAEMKKKAAEEKEVEKSEKKDTSAY